MTERNMPESAPRKDGTIRRAHYGAGKQPWDIMCEEGWGPIFAVCCILRYMRRDKEIEHSLHSAGWYFKRLVEMARLENRIASESPLSATVCLQRIRQLLSMTEYAEVVRSSQKIDG